MSNVTYRASLNAPGFRERCETIIPVHGDMCYKLSNRPIRIKQKDGRTVWGYNLWEVDKDGRSINGNRWKKRLGSNYNDAVRKLAKLRYDLQNGSNDPDSIRADAFFTLYRERLSKRYERGKIRKDHFEDSIRYIDDFEQYLRTTFNRIPLLDTIKTLDIDKYFEFRLERSKQFIGKRGIIRDGLAGVAMSRKAIRQAMTHAVKKGFLSRNPVDNTDQDLPTRQDTPPFTIELLQSVLDVMPTDTYEHRMRRNMILLIAYLGARAITLRYVRVCDVVIDGEESAIVLTHNKDKREYTQPVVTIAEFAIRDQLENLASHFGQVDGDAILFGSPKTGGVLHKSTPSHWMNDLIANNFADDPAFNGITFRSLRTFVGTEVAVRVDPETARIVLTHKHISTTQTYYIKYSRRREYDRTKIGLESIPNVRLNSEEGVELFDEVDDKVG